jgi:hypothetical protein
MSQDQYDYYLYSIRRFTLKAFEGFVKLMDVRVYQNSTVIKSAISLIRLHHRVDKNREEELEKFKPDQEAYLASDDYKQEQEKMSKLVDEAL